ncbi:hypothetical protein C9374_010093 [Naegleria lovaniensis]|uniref:Transmembrane protein n=1 Tax=Naegleria lovaniensis TaxID=51637 RepID=A0AA88GIA9_NAELO|nr:uncharacterized protein C9374_010093 [Naegleria lovaniensis]KAG2375089.1 hypothetical protein C9374_010093 [Naegleria lovaniensis]
MAFLERRQIATLLMFFVILTMNPLSEHGYCLAWKNVNGKLYNENVMGVMAICATCSMQDNENPSMLFQNFIVNEQPQTHRVFYLVTSEDQSSTETMQIVFNQILDKPTILVLSGVDHLIASISVTYEYTTVKSSVLQNLKKIIVNSRFKGSISFNDNQVQNSVQLEYLCNDECSNNLFVYEKNANTWDNGGKQLEQVISQRIGYNYTTYLGVEKGVKFEFSNAARDCSFNAEIGVILAAVLSTVIGCSCCCCLLSCLCGLVTQIVKRL